MPPTNQHTDITMKTCAFLSMDSLENFEVYDQLLYDPFKSLGWWAEEVSWRDTSVNWDSYDAVIIRSPWDYQKDPEAFLQVLERIEASSAVLENSLELVRWNIDKTYLRDLRKEGVEIVPSLWYKAFASEQVPEAFEELGTGEIVVKPTVSAGADHTFRIGKSHAPDYLDELSAIFSSRPFLIQPFMPNIVDEGEFSVFFFGHTYSHTILKTPKKNDFRVQEEHGGRLQKVEAEPQLLETARGLLDTINPVPLYSRMDYVRTSEDRFALMELELIEPSLYFNMDPESPERFAAVFDRWMKERLADSGKV